jgi:replicative DNA helicase
VIFIHRPEKYDIYEDEQGNSLIGLAEIILAKHRNGPIGDIQLKFKNESAKFVELDALLPLKGNEQEGSAFTVGSKMNQEELNDEPPY